MSNKSAVEQALEAATETRALRIGQGFLSQVAELFWEQFPGRKAIVVADQNTYRVAGKQVVAELEAGGIPQEPLVVFNDPDLYAEYTYVDRLTGNFGSHHAIPVAVGSGTINDLVKLASHLTGRPYMCVATAASMDGYTAFGASITAQGSKQTFNCPAPQAVLADVDVLSNAPPELTAAGYADLSAKITAGADWILADQLGEEAIDMKAWSIVQDGLPSALSDPKGVAGGNPEAIAKLVEGLMLGGFAMQYSRTSRCASGAEHQFSHLWNMEHFLYHGKLVSHGFQVSLGMLAVTALYEQVLNHPWEKLDVEACIRAWPSPEESDAKAIEMFAGTNIPLLGLKETRAKYINHNRLGEQLNHLKANWPEIRTLLEQQIVPYHVLKRKLKLAGAPVDPEEIGMSRERLRDSYIRAWSIRRRFTVLDLAVRAASLDRWLDGIFKKGGVWETT